MEIGVDKSVALKAILVRVVAATGVSTSSVDAFCSVYVGDQEPVKVRAADSRVSVGSCVLTNIGADKDQVEDKRPGLERMLYTTRHARRSRIA